METGIVLESLSGQVAGNIVIKPGIPLFLLILISVLGGCSGGSTFKIQNPPTNSVPSAAVSIAFQSPPVGTVVLGFTTQLAAVVSNDPNNYGVDWSLNCSATDCGVLSIGNKQSGSLHTQSGEAITYKSPSTLAQNQLSVSIVAFATADSAKNVVAALNVTGFLGNLTGTYVFQARGTNSDATTGVEGPFQIAGAIVLDGNGGISGGEETFGDSSISQSTMITGGTYTLGSDGYGTLTIKTSDTTLGNNGTQTFRLVYLDASQLLITQTDGVASTAGRMMLQTASIGALTGGYAFAVSGVDSNGVPTAFGGVFNIDQPNAGTISGNGSLADQGYLSTDPLTGNTTLNVKNCPAPTAGTPNTGLTGTVLPIPGDKFAAIDITLSACFASGPLQFMGFPVDGGHLLLIETDNNGTGSGFSTSGIAIGQGSATGKFVKTFSNTYVFGVSGFDSSASASSLAFAGRIVADGAGDLQGFIDEFGFSGSPSTSAQINAIYTEDPTGSGRVDTSMFSSSGSVPIPGLELLFYQTGSGNPLVMLTLDSNAIAVGAGIAYQQASPPAQFSGEYGFIGSGPTASTNPSTSNITGQMTVAVNQAANSLQVTGSLFSPAVGSNAKSLTGNFTLPPDNGRFSGKLSVPLDPALPNPVSVVLYLADNSHGFILSPITGSVLFGNVAAKTPVCQGCP